MAAIGGPLENHLDKSLAVRWRFHRWATGGPPEACYQGCDEDSNTICDEDSNTTCDEDSNTTCNEDFNTTCDED